MPLIQRHVSTVSYAAEATIRNYRIIKFGSNDEVVIQATAGSDLFFGVSHLPLASSDPWPVNQTTAPEILLVAGDTIDIVFGGHPWVEFGATVARGAPVTSDEDGRAITATTGNQVLGFAAIDAVIGDVGPVIIARSVLP